MTIMHTPRRRSLGSALPTFTTLLLCAGPLFGQPPPAQPPPAQPPPATMPQPRPGAEGASCRALVDCRQSLKCFQGVCRDPNYGNSCQTDQHCGVRLPCVRGVCLDAASAYGPPPPGPPPPGMGAPPPGAGPPPGGWAGPPPPPLTPIERDWMDFEIGHGVNPFIGISGLPGFSFGLDHARGTTGDVLASMMFAVKVGIFFDDTALELELSPVTYIPFLDGGDGHLQMNLSLGTYNELTDHVYWPGRFGLGFVTVNTPTTLFEMRADLLGIAFGIGHVMLDLHFPSIRWVTDFDQGATFSFLFGAGVGYVF